MPEEVLHNDVYFDDFTLKLPETLPNKTNKFNGLNYSTLGEYRTQFDLRPIRNIVVKQNSPAGDDSSMYEVFSRLNTGGINLRPQEIRTSMYHSSFFDMLYRINQEDRWRNILQSSTPDLHMKDIEVLLRGFAMLVSNEDYSPSMVRFLNQFSRKSESNTVEPTDTLRSSSSPSLRAVETFLLTPLSTSETSASTSPCLRLFSRQRARPPLRRAASPKVTWNRAKLQRSSQTQRSPPPPSRGRQERQTSKHDLTEPENSLVHFEPCRPLLTKPSLTFGRPLN